MSFQHLLIIFSSFFFSKTFSTGPIRPHSMRTTNIGNSTHPQLFYQLPASNNDDYYNYGLLNAWSTSRSPPIWLRPVNSTSMSILLSSAIYALSSLPAHDLSKPYQTIGPEYSQRLAALDTRLVVKQYERSGIVNGSDYPPKAEFMRNQELLVAIWLLQMLYVPSGGLAPDQTKESAWWGCYLRGSWALSTCTATVMVQRDLWG